MTARKAEPCATDIATTALRKSATGAVVTMVTLRGVRPMIGQVGSCTIVHVYPNINTFGIDMERCSMIACQCIQVNSVENISKIF